MKTSPIPVDASLIAVKTSLIVAADEHDVIGVGGDLPWHLPADLRRFRRLTTGHVVVVGRRTQDSIVRRLGHPLPDRYTVVVTRQAGRTDGGSVLHQPSVPAALSVGRGIESFAGGSLAGGSLAGGGELFVIGGAAIYTQALDEVDRVYLTRVHSSADGDTVMPAGWLDPFSLVAKESTEDGGVRFSFLTYERG